MSDDQQQPNAPITFSRKPYSGFAVKDTGAAKAFYTAVLGLRVDESYGILHIKLDEDTQVIAYPKANHTPAEFTVLNLPVAEIEPAVRALTERGVQFQRYPGMPVDELGIFREGGPLIAWFTDPSGNVLSLIEEP